LDRIISIITYACLLIALVTFAGNNTTSAQSKRDHEINSIKIPRKDSSGRVVLPHKLQPATIKAGNTLEDSLSVTKKLISQTIGFLERDQAPLALYSIHEAMSNCPTGDTRTNAITTSYYALVQIKIGCHTKSVTSLNKCDSLCRKLGDVSLLAFHYNNLGLFNQKFFNQEKAEIYFRKSLAFSRAVGDNSPTTATALDNLAKGDGNSQEKIVYLNEAITINKTSGRTLSLGENYNDIAYQYISIGNFKKAALYLDSASIIGDNLDALGILYNNYDYRSILHAREGNYKSAYESTQKRKLAQQRILEKQNISDIEEIISKRLLSKKEYEINLQKKENDIRRLNLSLVIVLSVLIITILLFFYVYYYVNNKRRLQNLELKQAAAEIDVKYTQAELLNLATYINSRNEFLSNIQTSLSRAQKMSDKEVYSEIRRINLYIKNLQTKNEDVESVMNRISKINEDFIVRLSEIHPDLTKNDKNIALLLRANLSTKQISALMDCSPKSVNMARYRMRIHLQMESDTNLVAYLKSI